MGIKLMLKADGVSARAMKSKLYHAGYVMITGSSLDSERLDILCSSMVVKGERLTASGGKVKCEGDAEVSSIISADLSNYLTLLSSKGGKFAIVCPEERLCLSELKVLKFAVDILRNTVDDIIIYSGNPLMLAFHDATFFTMNSSREFVEDVRVV